MKTKHWSRKSEDLIVAKFCSWITPWFWTSSHHLVKLGSNDNYRNCVSQGGVEHSWCPKQIIFDSSLLYTTKLLSGIIMKWINTPREWQNWSNSNSFSIFTPTKLQLFVSNQLVNAGMFRILRVRIMNCAQSELAHFLTIRFCILEWTHTAQSACSVFWGSDSVTRVILY